MKNRMIKAVIIIALLIVTIISVSSTHTLIPISQQNAPFSLAIKTTAPEGCFRDETELKYYVEENLDQVIGVCAEAIWKSAIRLTQDEMSAYMNWTLTKVNVASTVDRGCDSVDIRIFIYDKGTQTQPGPLIVSDTACRLNTTGVHTIPLVTPVNLSGREELWVAVQWTENSTGSYAWMDTLSGPHVPNKSDFVYLHLGEGGDWQQLHDALPTADGRWGIGAIVEGNDRAELSIGNVRGPLGIKANVSNIGTNNANNVQWSITITGGLVKRINLGKAGSSPSIVAGSSIQISTGVFFGFGKINIEITTKAQNAIEVSATKSAFLLGLFVVGIK
jgi:hypothetical protein